MPSHDIYIEIHLGGGAIMKRKPRSQTSIGIDLNNNLTDCDRKLTDKNTVIAEMLEDHTKLKKGAVLD